MKKEKVSNYIKLCDEWAEKFLRMDKAELMKKLPELKQEDGYLKLCILACLLESGNQTAKLNGWMERPKPMRRRC